MRPILRISATPILLASVLLITGCETNVTFPLTSMHLDVPANTKRVLIVDRHIEYPKKPKAFLLKKDLVNKINGRISEIHETTPLRLKRSFNALNATKSSKIEYIVLSTRFAEPVGKTTLERELRNAPTPLSSNEAAELCKKYNADGLIAIDKLGVFQQTYEIDDENSPHYGKMEHTVTVSVAIRSHYGHNGEVIDWASTGGKATEIIDRYGPPQEQIITESFTDLAQSIDSIIRFLAEQSTNN